MTSELSLFVSHTQFSGKIPSIHVLRAPNEKLQVVSSTTDIYFFTAQTSNKIAHDSQNFTLKRIQIHTLDFYGLLSRNIICPYSGSWHTENVRTDHCCYSIHFYLSEYKCQCKRVVKLAMCWNKRKQDSLNGHSLLSGTHWCVFHKISMSVERMEENITFRREYYSYLFYQDRSTPFSYFSNVDGDPQNKYDLFI